MDSVQSGNISIVHVKSTSEPWTGQNFYLTATVPKRVVNNNSLKQLPIWIKNRKMTEELLSVDYVHDIPIISPPPAFQDNIASSKKIEENSSCCECGSCNKCCCCEECIKYYPPNKSNRYSSFVDTNYYVEPRRRFQSDHTDDSDDYGYYSSVNSCGGGSGGSFNVTYRNLSHDNKECQLLCNVRNNDNDNKRKDGKCQEYKKSREKGVNQIRRSESFHDYNLNSSKNVRFQNNFANQKRHILHNGTIGINTVNVQHKQLKSSSAFSNNNNNNRSRDAARALIEERCINRVVNNNNKCLPIENNKTLRTNSILKNGRQQILNNENNKKGYRSSIEEISPNIWIHQPTIFKDSLYQDVSPSYCGNTKGTAMNKKSSSLPRSFDHDRKRNKKYTNEVCFEWNNNAMKDFLLSKRRLGNARSVMSETAPTTPVKDMPDKKRCGRLMRLGQYSSSPSLDKDSSKEIVFDCNGRYFYKNDSSSKLDYDERQVPSSSQDENTQACNIGDRVLQRFCKSFSLRFLKKSTSNDGDEPGNISSMNVQECEDKKKPTYKFGPLSWRCSKERKNKPSTTPDSKPNVPNSLDVVQKPIPTEEHLAIESKPHTHPSIRRTLSDLNGYGDVVKEKAFNATASSKCKSSIPVPTKKNKQYKLRRTNSQPLFPSRYSPVLRKASENVMMSHKTAYSEDERALFSEDDMMSDSGSSLPSRKASLEQGINDEVVILAEAVWDHIAMESQELPFEAGDVIQVYNVLDRDWWWGMANGKSGWFPSDFVRLRVNQEEPLDNFTTSTSNKRPLSVSTYSSDEIRSKIVCELINTERDFVRVLQDITEAFVRECRYADNLFSSNEICTIFGNWEELTAFQFSFLQDLECNIDWGSPCKSCIGNVFLRHRKEFYMYSDYCNNHPVSMATLQQLYQKSEYRNFFEKCRLKRGLIEIPLDGFLLTPVQRICKYPLQLAELLKYTETDHADYEYVKEALETMRDVAVLINERKRRMESLEKLILWQQRVDGWMGVDVVERSCQLIHQGDVTKLLMGTWCTNVTLFLFDYQLIYCKKDIIKRDHYVYKGRIALSSYEVIDLPDGKDNVIGINVRNGIKIHSFEEDNFLLFCCRSHKDKMNWLDAFEREKQLVCQDRSSQLQITSTDRSLAYITANTCTRRHSFVKHRNKKFKHALHGNSENRRAARSSYLLGRRMGNWFMFGANRKPLSRSRIETNIT